MHIAVSMTELPVPKRSKMCIGDQHDHLEYSTEHEALVSLANDMFGLHAWSHTVTHQIIGKCTEISIQYFDWRT